MSYKILKHKIFTASLIALGCSIGIYANSSSEIAQELFRIDPSISCSHVLKNETQFSALCKRGNNKPKNVSMRRTDYEQCVHNGGFVTLSKLRTHKLKCAQKITVKCKKNKKF